MMLTEEILLANCNLECPRHMAGTCPFPLSEKGTCPRVKAYIRSVYNCAVPEQSNVSAEEILNHPQLMHETWKTVATKFNMDEDSFKSIIKIVGKIDEQ